MKKLLTLIAAIALGVAAQANTIQWGLTLVSPSSGTTTTTDYTAYLFISSVSSSTDALASYATSLSSVTTALSKNDTSVLSGAIDSMNATVVPSGTQAGKANFTTKAVTGKSATAGTTVDAYAIILDASESNYLVALYSGDEILSKKVAEGNSGAYQFLFGSQASNTAWVAMVPEPTSGVLMLVGMGVLALRRKRA